MLRKLFHSKSSQPQTIADAILRNKRLIFTCKACNSVTSKEPKAVFFKPRMELKALEALTPCPECGECNLTGQQLRVVLTIES